MMKGALNFRISMEISSYSVECLAPKL